MDYEEQDVIPVTFSDNNQQEEEVAPPPSHAHQASQDFDDSPAFLFSVSEPEKRTETGGMKLTYWTYKLTCNTRLQQYQNQTLICQRRYNDFLWLRDQLFNAYPGVIVPPLPEKSLLGTVEKILSSAVDSKALLEYRQRALTKFLTRVGEHPTLQTSKELQIFLELDEKAFDSQKGAQTVEAPAPTGFFSTLMKKSTSKEPEFISEQRKFISKLEDGLKMLKDKLQHLVDKRKEMSVSIADFGKSFRLLGTIEKDWTESTMSHSMGEIGNKAEQLSVSTLTQADRETMQVVETLTYYLGMCESIKRIAKILDSMRLDRDDLGEKAKAAKTNVEKAEANTKTTPDKLQQLRTLSEQADQKEQTAVSNTRKAEDQFLQDIERFDMERKVDFAYMLDAFVSLQVEYSTTMQKSWEALIPSIRMITEEGTGSEFENLSPTVIPQQQQPIEQDEYADYTGEQ